MSGFLRPFPVISIAFPRKVETPKGKRKRKVYRPVAVVAVLRLTEDTTSEVKELSLVTPTRNPRLLTKERIFS
jgi:hypothetical protein